MACAYLLLKLFLVWSIARLVQPTWQLEWISSLVAGWIAVQAIQAGLILGLSAIGLLNRPLFLTLTLIYTAWIYWWTRSFQTDHKLKCLWDLKHPALIAIFIVLLLVFLRSLFLYDFTYDAQTYGIPRLAIWLNRGSVFVHMPTPQLNLFVNEWNAEFNALAFALISGGYSGFAFGNLEVLLWLFVSMGWVAHVLGASKFWAIALSAVVGSAPVMLGLATTIKGDLLAITAFAITIGWLACTYRRRDQSPICFAMLLISATIAIGAKISVVLPVIAICAMGACAEGMHGIRKILRWPTLTKALFILTFMIFSSRLWTNLIVYGNPLQRIGVEKTHFSIENIFGNLDLTSLRTFGVLDEMYGKGAMFALYGSMGAAGWFIVIAVVLVVALRGLPRFRSESCLLTRNKCVITDSQFVWMGGTILFTTLASMTLSAPYPWSFRYFAPGIVILFILVGGFVLHEEPNGWWRRICSIFAVLVVLINVNIVMREGEVFPAPNWSILVDRIKSAETPLQRISLLIEEPYRIAAVDALQLDSTGPLNMLIFQDIDTPLVPFVGSRAQNTMRFVANESDLITAAAKADWDVVAILQLRERRSHSLNVALEQKGYMILVDSSQYVIAMAPHRLTLVPIATLSKITWSTWKSADNTLLAIHNGMPEIQSGQSVDAGFITQEFFVKGPTFIRARFEGEIRGKGAHAAHLSLHGKYPIIALASGVYSSAQWFQGIIPASTSAITPQRLSFGLGGWTEGSGHLRLVQLEMFELQVNKVK